MGSKKLHQTVCIDTKRNQNINNRSIILGDQQVEIMTTVILGIFGDKIYYILMSCSCENR